PRPNPGTRPARSTTREDRSRRPPRGGGRGRVGPPRGGESPALAVPHVALAARVDAGVRRRPAPRGPTRGGRRGPGRGAPAPPRGRAGRAHAPRRSEEHTSELQ